MKFFLPGLFLVTAAPAALTFTPSFAVNAGIPDNSAVGRADTRIVETSIERINHLRVTIEVSGGWNGDLYAYLAHDTGFTVLLNRIGRTTRDNIGSGTSGLEATFDDAALFDIHLGLAPTGIVSGSYQPDGRPADPATALDTSPRSAWLASFNGLNPNGRWTLFISDLAAGDTATLTRWSLEITGIPEPAAVVLTLFGLGLLSGRKRPVKSITRAAF